MLPKKSVLLRKVYQIAFFLKEIGFYVSEGFLELEADFGLVFGFEKRLQSLVKALCIFYGYCVD